MRLALALFAAVASAQTGSRVCAQCHRAIYESYMQTPMARTSGAVSDDVGAGAEFTAAGFRYRMRRERGGLSFEFEKPDGALHGAKTLAYFVGSGATARSYLLVDDRFYFEAPVAFYSGSQRWGLAPAYDTYAYPYLTRPVTTACLNCHASGLRPMAQTLNRFEVPPFSESGIGCERCHGPGDRHVKEMSAATMVNPGQLNPAERDSICSECHLTGAVRVIAAGKRWNSFQPGARLSDSVKVFVKAGTSPGMTVTSHVEKLARSVCKQKSGGRLWCGSCHDPHRVPKASEAAAWFRTKCMVCHETKGCTETAAARASKQDDCTACHMPKTGVTDAQHVVYTDHSIPRRPRAAAADTAAVELVPFDGFTVSDRDTALAYGIAAGRERSGTLRFRALAMLRKAEREHPNDAELLMYLAELYRNGEQPDLAISLYQRAMRLDPSQLTASVGLGGIFMERGQFAEAIPLWEDALTKNSGLELVRTNLAMAYWRMGDLVSAERHLAKAIALSPAFAPASDLLKRLRQR